MEGYLDHLETTGSVGRQKKIWVRRFFKLNTNFRVLEVFTDKTQRERKGKLELQDAVVATADELGGLLNDDKDEVELSRRFIFRITEKGSKNHHYLCANLNGATSISTYKLASSTREYLEEWLQALRSTITAGAETPLSDVTMGLGELNALIGAFMNHMHLSARISKRTRQHGKSIYEITVKAWILERELVMVDEDQDAYRPHASVGSGDMTWQILEYSCAWKLQKCTADLRSFDDQLRLLFSANMHHIAFPPSSIGTKLQQLHVHTSASQKETENQQRMQLYDTYFQSLLRLPALSSFGSDASTMLDTFFDISPHLVPFRKLEKEIGQSMHLRNRKVVPWKDRQRFEMVYKMHLQVIATQEKNARRVQMDQVAPPRKNSRARHQHRHSRHHYVEENISLDDTEADQALVEAYVAPLPAPVKFDTEAEEARPGESVQERMARIGHRLVVQAFDA